MIPKPCSQITFVDLESLVDAVGEGKTIEYKREMPAKTNEEVVKFLAAATSFANTAGGDLLIGIDANSGIAKAIPGISLGDLDQEKLRLEQLLLSGIEPRIPRVEIEGVKCRDDRHVIIVRVHRSWIAPHRVVRNGTFYGRNSAGKYSLDVGELRTAFVLSESVAQRIRNFRDERIAKIVAGETPVVLQPGPAMTLHVVPFATFAAGRRVDVVQSILTGSVMPLPPSRMYYSNRHNVNLDGVVTYPDSDKQSVRAYAQAFRSGAIEGVAALGIDNQSGSPYLLGSVFEKDALIAVRNYLMFVRSIDLGFPVFIFLSFCGMKGCHLRIRTALGGSSFYTRGPIQEEVIVLPEIVIEQESADVIRAMRPIFDTVWNAFGIERSDKYNDKGEWIGPDLSSF